MVSGYLESPDAVRTHLAHAVDTILAQT
jgi:hypothetical protein